MKRFFCKSRWVEKGSSTVYMTPQVVSSPSADGGDASTGASGLMKIAHGRWSAWSTQMDTHVTPLHICFRWGVHII